MQAVINDKQGVTNSTIKSMIEILAEQLKKDNQLANELLSFLHQHNVDVPVLGSSELKNLIPVSYTQKNAHVQMRKVKKSFEGIETAEYLL